MQPGEKTRFKRAGVVIDLPIITVSEANRRDHWAVRAHRVRVQRGLAEAEQ